MGRTKKISGVYAIQCTENGKVYIGSSKSVRKRMCYHRDMLKRGKHWNRYLAEDWISLGPKKFSYIILEECPHEDLLKNENKWMMFYKSNEVDNGYNVLNAYNNQVLKENTYRRVFNPNRKKNVKGVVCINPQGEITNFTSIKLAAESLCLSAKKISDCSNYWKGTTKKKSRSCSSYLFIPTCDYDETFDYINYRHPKKEIIRKEKVKKEPKPYSERNIARKPIKIVSVDGKEENFSSILEAVTKYLFVRTKVSKCLRNNKYTHRGYKFYYVN